MKFWFFWTVLLHNRLQLSKTTYITTYKVFIFLNKPIVCNNFLPPILGSPQTLYPSIVSRPHCSYLGTQYLGKMSTVLAQLHFGSWKAHWLAISMIRGQEFHTEWEYKQRCTLTTSWWTSCAIKVFLTW